MQIYSLPVFQYIPVIITRHNHIDLALIQTKIPKHNYIFNFWTLKNIELSFAIRVLLQHASRRICLLQVFYFSYKNIYILWEIRLREGRNHVPWLICTCTHPHIHTLHPTPIQLENVIVYMDIPFYVLVMFWSVIKEVFYIVAIQVTFIVNTVTINVSG